MMRAPEVLAGPLGPIAYDISGSGPPLVLLHGFPQTRAMWHRIAPDLAQHYTVICPDLRGYGASAKPDGVGHYSFRAMGDDIRALLDHLGIARAHIAGHDRGARVAHRFALDSPSRLRTLTVMDIIPTHTLFTRLTHDVANSYYHWFFLAQPAPLPDDMIAADPDSYFEACLRAWGPETAPAFAPEALAAYRTAWRAPGTIRAMCDDYRAAATLDLADDTADLGAQVTCPALVLFAAGGLMDRAFDMEAVWAEKLTSFETQGMPHGHFFPDHAPRQTAERLRAFLAAHDAPQSLD